MVAGAVRDNFYLIPYNIHVPENHTWQECDVNAFDVPFIYRIRSE